METFSNTGEPWFLMGPTARFVPFAEKLRAGHKRFGATLDLSHLQQMGEDPVQSLRTAAGVCPHIHIANCVISDPAHPLYGDKHPQFGHEAGAADEKIIRNFLNQFLRQSGSRRLMNIPPVIGLEVITRPPDQPAETMIYAKKYADAVFETL
jgi:sugar phosphate isomerase/epimerase